MNLFISYRTTFTNAREHEVGQRPGGIANGSITMEIRKVEKFQKALTLFKWLNNSTETQDNSRNHRMKGLDRSWVSHTWKKITLCIYTVTDLSWKGT